MGSDLRTWGLLGLTLAASALALASCSGSDRTDDIATVATSEAALPVDANGTASLTSPSAEPPESSVTAFNDFDTVEDMCNHEDWIAPLCPTNHSPGFDIYGGFRPFQMSQGVFAGVKDGLAEGEASAQWGFGDLIPHTQLDRMTTEGFISLDSISDSSRMFQDRVDELAVPTDFCGPLLVPLAETAVRGVPAVACVSERPSTPSQLVVGWVEEGWFYKVDLNLASARLLALQTGEEFPTNIDIHELLATLDGW